MPVIFKKSVKMGGYIAHMKIQKVRPDSNRPDGFKVNFVVVDLETKEPVLLVDNHHPFGYHLHTNPSGPNDERIQLESLGPFEALDIFLAKAKEIADDT